MASKFPNTETPDSGIRPGHSTPAFRSMGTRLGSLCLTLLFISHGAKGQQSESNIPDLPPPTTIGSVPAVSSTVAPPFAPALAPASTSPQPGSAPSLESPPQPNPSVPLDLAPPSAEIRAPSSLPRVIEIASQTPGTPSVPAPPSPGDGLPEALVAQPESDALATDPEAEFLNPIQEGKSVIEVVVGRSKIFESKRPFGRILISDPAVADVQLLDQESIEPKLLNLFGLRFGTTSLTLWDTNGRSETFTVRVTIDVPDLQARIAEIFPGADVSIRQIGSQIILEGEVPSAKVMNEVLRLVSADLRLAAPPDTQGLPAAGAGASGGGGNLRAPINVTSVLPGFGVIINRVRVPGPRQVLLRVKIAELNRTAMRQLGVSWLDTRSNNMIGSTVGAAGDLAASGSATQAAAYAPLSLIPGAVSNPITSRMLAPAFSPVASAFNAAGSAATNANTQLFGIFNAGEFNIFINALRTNRIAKILAEPNLVSLDGQPARFQAGGSFPYPVPQAGAGGVGSVITIQYAQFGAILSFIPHILEQDVIRLDVEPNFSELNFAQGYAIPGTGGTVPGLNQRNARTVVELREGQTLAIAGLLSTRTNASTTRIPGLGDLPIIGPWFSRNEIETIETELVVLVTPELVEAMEPHEVPPGPGEAVQEPTDLEFFFLGRIEGKTGSLHRATVDYQDPLNVMKHFKSEGQWVVGPHGHAD